MTPEQFMEGFGVVAEAEGGVAGVRAMVLSLAVQGRLGTQSYSDESASVLLSRIRDANKNSVQKKKSAKKALGSEAKRKAPFQVPEGWAWAQFQDVATIASRLVNPAEYQDSPHIAPDNVEKGTGRLLPYRTIAEDAVTSNKHLFLPGAILYSKIRPNLSKAVIVDFEGLCSADMYPITAHISTRYLHTYILSGLFLRQVVSADNRVAMPKVNQDELSRVTVPVPPLAEQHRIVAKVDQLMSMLDDLKQRQEEKRSAAIHVSKASVDSLVNADEPNTLIRAWRRMDENISLVATEGFIDRLREYVLQLATRGKLSTRDDKQSAKELMNEIQADRAAAFDNGEAQCSKAPDVVAPEEFPYALPSHWSWVRVEDLCTFIVDCLHKTPRYVDNGGYPCIRTSEITRGALLIDKASRVSEETYLERIGRLRPIAGDIVYAREGRYGVAALVPPEVDVCLGQRTMMLRVSPLVSAEYFMWALNSETIFAQARMVVGGSTAPHVNIRAIRRFVFPLPPIKEQAQIAATIARLFTLCDQLESAYGRRAITRKHIVGSISHFGVSSFELANRISVARR